MPKTLEYEIVSLHNDSIVGRVWLDDDTEEVETDPAHLKEDLRGIYVAGESIDSGRVYLERIHSFFRSGYMYARRVRDEKAK